MKAFRIIALVAMIAAAVAVIASPASAQGPPRQGAYPRQALIQAAASYLGVTVSDLKADLKAGQTLAQVAAATPGKSVQGLTDALISAATTQINNAVAAGRLTAAQAATLLANVPAAVQ